MRPNRALWTLIKDNASYELTRACGKLCRIPCLKSTFAAPKCLYCGLQSTINSCLQSTEHGDDLRQDRGRLTRGSGLLPLASHLDRWLVGNAYLCWLQNPETSNFYSVEPIVLFQAISMRVKLNMLDNRRLCAGGALS